VDLLVQSLPLSKDFYSRNDHVHQILRVLIIPKHREHTLQEILTAGLLIRFNLLWRIWQSLKDLNLLKLLLKQLKYRLHLRPNNQKLKNRSVIWKRWWCRRGTSTQKNCQRIWNFKKLSSMRTESCLVNFYY